MKASFVRERRGRTTPVEEGRRASANEPGVRAARAARMLAVAHQLEAMIEKGELRDRGELARVLGLTPARVTQLLDLRLLAPDIQEELLFMRVPTGSDPVPERSLRYVVRALAWAEQRRRWAALREQGGRGSRSTPWAGRPLEARPERSSVVANTHPQSVSDGEGTHS